MQRSIGVTGVVVTLVGLVIGISIFILPGSLAASAGPSVILSYALASIMALFSCVGAAQIGVLFPVSGASFVAVSRLVSPFLGFLGVWFMVGGAAVASALVAFGFADYVSLLWREVDRELVASALVVSLGALNLYGARDSVFGQTLMVIAFMLALCVFSLVGLWRMDWSLILPLAPNGWQPVVAAAVPAYFSFAGFMMVMEIGGEIKQPGRTIPKALGISFLMVLVVYSLVSLVLVGIIPWQELGQVDAPVGEAARRILPPWIATAVTLTVVAAAGSTVNSVLLGYSRDILALARVRIFPALLARISPRHGEPGYAVVLMLLLSLSAIASGGGIVKVASLVVMGLMVLQIAVALALFQIPRRMPEAYRLAPFRLTPGWLKFFASGLMLCSLTFVLITGREDPGILLITVGYLAVGVAYYYLRRGYLARKSLQLERLIQQEISAIPELTDPVLK